MHPHPDGESGGPGWQRRSVTDAHGTWYDMICVTYDRFRMVALFISEASSFVSLAVVSLVCTRQVVSFSGACCFSSVSFRLATGGHVLACCVPMGHVLWVVVWSSESLHHGVKDGWRASQTGIFQSERPSYIGSIFGYLSYFSVLTFPTIFMFSAAVMHIRPAGRFP